MLRAGIVGLPNVGKTTFFNAVTAQSSALISTIHSPAARPDVGVVAVPGYALARSQNWIDDRDRPATVEFVDMPGSCALVLGRGAREPVPP